ncbi:cation diffusion facilitator family transporter [Larsenimonas salina]|uniref:cation diffusion facilitator family transporter n=1 Tax=Larsenimonas salina TaxID=1295565 RepID=UPI002073070E|nr:cation diffusion facilitator family transporter [Larsenimonas salina]MCM5703163.1 cation diffusion facilitator family transporter [Larsenimonas salina]
MQDATLDNSRRTAQRITLLGAVFDALLGGLKIAVGYVTQSGALVADGIHSLSDLITDAFVMLATHYGRQAPDSNHPYGHGRIETLGTLALGAMLIGVAAALAWDSLDRLLTGSTLSSAGTGAILLAAASMLIKEVLFRVTLHVARQQRSRLLEANAWHSRSDALSSLVVLVGLVGLQFGWSWFDSVAAIIVAAMVAKVGVEQIWHAGRELIDTALPPEEDKVIRELALGVDGVKDVHDVRTRTQSGSVMLDLHLIVGSRLSVSEGHEIGNEVIRTLRTARPELEDIVFHIDPEDDSNAPRAEHRKPLPLRTDVIHELEARWHAHPLWRARISLGLHYASNEDRRAIDVVLYVPAGLELPEAPYTALKESTSDLEWLGEITLWQTIPSGE